MSGAGRAGGVEGREGNDIDLAGPAVEEEGPGWENEPAEESLSHSDVKSFAACLGIHLGVHQTHPPFVNTFKTTQNYFSLFFCIRVTVTDLLSQSRKRAHMKPRRRWLPNRRGVKERGAGRGKGG